MDTNTLNKMRSRPVEEQAAAWMLAFEDGSPDDEARRLFVKWLKESPRHIEEFMQVSALHLELSESVGLAGTIDSLVAEAKKNVIELGGIVGKKNTRRSFRKVSWISGMAAGLLVAIFTGLSLSGVIFSTPETGEVVYQTDVGEQRSIILDDDSTLTLNTNSKVELVFTETGRHANLLQGEAMFEVTKDPSRPFTVNAGFLDVTVVGTVFNVYRQDEKATVTVVEGKVNVQYHQAGDIALDQSANPVPATNNNQLFDPVLITAGEQLAIADTGLVQHLETAKIAHATAWTERRLIFDNEPMIDVFAEFNRYNQKKLVLNYPEIAERQVTGVFDARDTDAILAFVQSHSEVNIVHTSDSILINRRY